MTSPVLSYLYPEGKGTFEQVHSNVSFQTIESHDFTIERFEGIIDIGTFLDCKRELYKHQGFSPKRNVLLDVRGVAFRMNYDEIQEAVRTLQEAFNTFRLRRIAIVADRPMEVAFGLSVKRIANEIVGTDNNVCVCALPSNGISWLLDEESCACVENKFSNQLN